MKEVVKEEARRMQLKVLQALLIVIGGAIVLVALMADLTLP